MIGLTRIEQVIFGDGSGRDDACHVPLDQSATWREMTERLQQAGTPLLHGERHSHERKNTEREKNAQEALHEIGSCQRSWPR